MSKTIIPATSEKKDKGNVEPIDPAKLPMPRLFYRLLINASPSGKEKVISDIIKATISVYDKKHVVTEDKMGNLILEIGERNKDHNTLFSCHMDTVHCNEGILHLGISKKNYEKGDGYVFAFTKGKLGGWCPEVLGADDKAGIYAILQLIRKKTPGLYIFHVGEEKGGIGSKWIAENNPDLVKDIKRAIAFDRKGTQDVIGEQRGSKCCSTDFGIALAARLNQFMPPKNLYKSGAIGSFTDTASYMKLIPECTNVSCGYYNEHTSSEHLDLYWYLDTFLPAVLKMNWETLPTVRDPTAVASRVHWYDNGNVRHFNSNWRLDLDNLLACKDEAERRDKLGLWLSTVMLSDTAKEFQLNALVNDVIKKLNEKDASTLTVDKDLLDSYVSLLKDYISYLGSDLASMPEKNQIPEDKVNALYANYDLITKFVGEYDEKEEDEAKPSLQELMILCIDYMFACVQVAGQIKSKSSGMIDITSDIIQALVKTRGERFLKGTNFRRNVRIPAALRTGQFAAMPEPCVKKCNMNHAYDICTGCNRTPDEKKKWWGMHFDKQKDVWNSCILRGMAFPEISPETEKSMN